MRPSSIRRFRSASIAAARASSSSCMRLRKNFPMKNSCTAENALCAIQYTPSAAGMEKAIKTENNGMVYIMDFAELWDFIDVPVKNFSSGMTARLAFSIATLVEPEILIVDEILSVGDIAFQKKSEEKMLSMIKGGTTVLFVSHSLAQIEKLCDRVVWLDHGKVVDIGEPLDLCARYAKFMEEK